MIRNYLKIAIRTFLREKVFSFINITGLAIGIATCVIIALYVQHEMEYDRHNKDADRIFRVVKDFVNDDGTFLPDATTPPAIGPALQAEVPEIDAMTRLFPTWGRQYYIRYGESKRFVEESVYRVDSSFFDVFTVQFISGDPKEVFKDRKSVVVTKSTAKKYFGSDDPMGKILQLDNMGDYQVTGVIEDLPSTSHFTFNFLISTRTLGGGNIDLNWGWYNYYTYIKLKPGTSIASVEPKIIDVFKKHQPQNTNRFYTQALTEIHLNSNLKWELQPNGDKAYVYVMICVALFVVVIASVNYVNLATARSASRAKEIGVRKVSGAYRNSLVAQFLSESVVTSVAAFLLASLMVKLILPFFNNITGASLVWSFNSSPEIMLYAFGAAVVLGVLAGLYPAFYLSSFKPILILKGSRGRDRGKVTLRKALVVLQFTISIILIVGILVISRQIDFVQSAKLGLDKDEVMVVKDVGYLSRTERSSLKNSMHEIAGVRYVAGCDGIPGGQNWTNSVRMKGSENELLLNFLNVDTDFLDALSIPVKEGRGFTPEFPGDTLDGIILNEAAVKSLGIKHTAVGQQLVWGEDADTVYYATIVGIVPDFHFTSMRSEIKPFAFVIDHNRMWQFAVKLETNAVSETVQKLEKTWNTMVPERPFQYYFLDSVYDRLYHAERNFKTMFLYVTSLALFIACMGLFGLSAFITEQRTKEVAIRKVIGSSVMQILVLLSTQFVKLVVVAFLVAAPLAWLAVDKWLQGFAYRIDVGWSVFVIAGISSVLIALVTVSVQTLKTATANPVRSLRSE
jgi:putative ABC transport system permease protein